MSMNVAEHQEKVRVIREVFFPRLLRLRTQVRLEYRVVDHFVLPGDADPGVDPEQDPATVTDVSARICGCPLLFEGDAVSVVCRDGTVLTEGEVAG